MQISPSQLLDETISGSTFEPLISSTFNTGAQLPKTFKFMSCSRVILERFRALHLKTCVPQDVSLQMSAGTSNSPALVNHSASNKENIPCPTTERLATVPIYSLDERKTMLIKFEVLLLTPPQIAEFSSLYEERNLVQEEPLFSAWLTLKLATIPTEKEALDKVLRSHEAINVPKRKTKRKQNVPSGPARFDPSSQDWISILEETGKTSAAKKKKPNQEQKEPKKKTKKVAQKTPAGKAKKKSISISA